jgi:hypothetical protein
MSPTKVTERTDPLPTTIYEAIAELKDQKPIKLPMFGVVWLEAPEFAAQSVTVGGVMIIVLKELVREY